MNQMILYAQCVAIRDRQISEKKRLADESKESERRLDLMMEIDRLKGLQEAEEREMLKREKRMQDAVIIRQQKAEAARRKIIAQEQRELEGKQMVAQIEIAKREELERLQRKREEGKQLLTQVMTANRAAIAAKDGVKQRELAEDLRILQYLREKEARDREIEEEKEAVAAEKEREVGRLRAMQEKAQDKQTEIDALRARRYQDEQEAIERATELAAIERRRAVQADLAAAREEQAATRNRRALEDAAKEQDEFQRIIRVQRAENESELRRAEEKKQDATRHSLELRQQIEGAEKLRASQRSQFLEEGEHIKRQLAMERAKLERIKASKLELLQKQNVPLKYTAELARLKIGGTQKFSK